MYVNEQFVLFLHDTYATFIKATQSVMKICKLVLKQLASLGPNIDF